MTTHPPTSFPPNPMARLCEPSGSASARPPRPPLLACGLALLFLLPLPTLAQQDPSDADGIVRAIYDAQLAFPIPGAVADVPVSPGDRVDAGAVLARLDDRAARAEAELAQFAASSDAALKLARERLELAKLADAEQARGPAAVARGEDQRAQINLRIAELEVQRQQHLLDLAKREFAAAAARLAQHTLKAPVAGVIDRVLVSPGQFSDAGQPVLRLLTPERLVVEANIPSDRAAALKEGTAVTLYPKTGDPTQPPTPAQGIRGTISFLAGTLDPETDSRLIRIEPQGQVSLLPGSFVSIDLDPAPQP